MWSITQLEQDAEAIVHPEISSALASLREEAGKLAATAISANGSVTANRLAAIHHVLTDALGTILPAPVADVVASAATPAVESVVEDAAKVIETVATEPPPEKSETLLQEIEDAAKSALGTGG